jgi:hypothetical protein
LSGAGARDWASGFVEILPKLRSGSNLKIELEFSVTVPGNSASGLVAELRQLLQELGLGEALQIH